MNRARTLALLLLLFAPARAALADVANYDYANRTQGTQIFAYQGQSTLQVPTTNTTPSAQLSAAQYDAIETNNGVFHSFDATSNSNYAQMRFEFRIDQAETSVTQLTGTWNGLNANNNNGKTDGARLYLWNYTTGAYELLQASADTEAEVTLSGTRSASLTSYIGGAAQDTVLLLAVSSDTNQGTPKVNELRTDYVQLQVTYGAGVDHFLISHDGAGIHCLAEPIRVTAVDASNATFTSYTGSITLDTQSGQGTWSLVTGSGTFLDAVAGDGLATYTFAGADSGTALFALSYSQGTPALDVDAFETALTTRRDDDTEGTLTFAASGFTVTANALANPPPNPINDPIGNRTAGTTVALFLAAYGTTPTDTQCGVIESYTGAKTLRFWTTYADPTTGTVRPTVGGTSIGSNEAGAVAIGVTFTNGQASVSAKYKDVGRIQIEMKDINSGGPATGIRGATNPFVWRPADFVITQVLRASDNFANPGTSTPTGTIFVGAGRAFGVKVQVRDAEGSLTPNYGRETSPEGLRLTASTLVAPVGGRNGSANNGAIGNATAFGTVDQNGNATAAGEFYGGTFSWDEVGAIRLRTNVADASYLGTGDVSGTESGTVGRFTPASFTVTLNTPRFVASCSAGSFTYLGAPFSYEAANVPQLGVTAVALAGTTTRNYAGSWFRITNASLGTPAYSAASGTLDTSGLPAIDPVIADNGNGTATLVFGSGTGLRFVRSALAAPFDAEISLAQNVTDLDAVAYASNPARFGQASAGNGIAFTTAKTVRFGRISIANAHGSELSSLPMTLRAEYWNGIGFIASTSDSCTAIAAASLVLTPSPAGLSTTPSIANNPLAAGNAGLVLSAPGAGNRGTVDVRPNLGAGGALVPWLRYDWPADGLDGVFDDDPIGRATFGIFAGDDPTIFRREVY